MQSNIHRALTTSQASRLLRKQRMDRGQLKETGSPLGMPGTSGALLSEVVTDKKEKGSKGNLVPLAPPLLYKSEKTPKSLAGLGWRQGVALIQ